MSENEEFLSEHTIAMRKALDACQSLLAPREQDGKVPSWVDLLLPLRLDPELMDYSTSIASLDARRNDALTKWKDVNNCDSLESIHHGQNGESPSSTWYFRQQFHQANQPCRIHGLAESCFRRVNSMWTSPLVFRQWMRQVFSPRDDNDDTPHLPVRRTGTQEATLDEDGRATECITVNMSFDQWIEYLDCEHTQNSNDKTKDYLKDWHLEAWLEDKKLLDFELYQKPDIFGHDLLDPFLRAFTKGDYRFVYWGPAGSRTDWHSDVLNSFSWSYNVFGCKEWTFVIPETYRHVKIVQRAGECIFVPATWKHQVVNLEETLSINRNWLTSANLDLCWNCLTTEIRSIENELLRGDRTMTGKLANLCYGDVWDSMRPPFTL